LRGDATKLVEIPVALPEEDMLGRRSTSGAAASDVTVVGVPETEYSARASRR